MLKLDPITGDYGPNFFGHAWNTATYIVDHPQFGWLAFGGNLKKEGDTVKVTPLDSQRQRVFISSLGLWLTLDAGTFENIEVNAKTGGVRVGLAGATSFTPLARLRVEEPAHAKSGAYRPAKELPSERGAWVVPLGKETTWLELTPDR